MILPSTQRALGLPAAVTKCSPLASTPGWSRPLPPLMSAWPREQSSGGLAKNAAA